MNKLLMGAAAAAAVLLAVPAIAQQKPTASASVPIPKNTFYKGVGPTQYLVKTRLIGQNVVDKSGAKIGDIEDVIIGSKDNGVDGVVIGVGGFLGVGEKKIGVRLSALKFDTKDGKTVISMPAANKELLAAVLPYEGYRTTLQKAGDAVKGAAAKASDAAKGAASKASDMAKDAAAKAGAAAKNITGSGEPAKK